MGQNDVYKREKRYYNELNIVRDTLIKVTGNYSCVKTLRFIRILR